MVLPTNIAAGQAGHADIHNEANEEVNRVAGEVDGRLSQSELSETITGSVVALRAFPAKTLPVSKMIQYFGDGGAGWEPTAPAPGVINMEDTSVPMLGSRSFMISPGPNNYAHARKPEYYDPYPSFSVVDKVLRVWLRTEPGLTHLTVHLSSGANYVNYISQNVLAYGFADVGEDYYIDVPLGAATKIGDPDLGAIQYVRVLADSGATQGVAWIGAIALVDQDVTTYPNGVISLTFDDNAISHYTVARPRLARYGFAGTIYPNIAAIGAEGSMSLAQMKYMADVQGWEIGAHSIDLAHHVDHVGRTEEWLRDHFGSIVDYMRANGLRGNSFAWPNTTSDALARRVAADYFKSARGGAGAQIETITPTRPMNLRAVNGATSLDELKGYVDRAKLAKGWQPFFFHRIVENPTDPNDISTADFNALIDYIAASNVPVATVGQVLN